MLCNNRPARRSIHTQALVVNFFRKFIVYKNIGLSYEKKQMKRALHKSLVSRNAKRRDTSRTCSGLSRAQPTVVRSTVTHTWWQLQRRIGALREKSLSDASLVSPQVQPWHQQYVTSDRIMTSGVERIIKSGNRKRCIDMRRVPLVTCKHSIDYSLDGKFLSSSAARWALRRILRTSAQRHYTHPCPASDSWVARCIAARNSTTSCTGTSTVLFTKNDIDMHLKG